MVGAAAHAAITVPSGCYKAANYAYTWSFNTLCAASRGAASQPLLARLPLCNVLSLSASEHATQMIPTY